MSDDFVQPDARELTEAGLIEETPPVDVDEPSAAGHTDVLSEDFKERWREILEMPSEEILERVADTFADQPQRGREILSVFLAQELGYGRLFRHPDSVRRRPLWDLLDEQMFVRLDGGGQRALEQIACSTRPGRPGFHPLAALAAVALWRHGDRDQQAIAGALLEEHALPDEPEWLYELVTILARLDGDCLGTRSLHELARVQLGASFWDSAALLAAFYLVREFAPSWVGSPMTHLVAGCDRAAERRPQSMRPWLDLLADAAIGGHLNYVWLEKPMRAAIRLSIDRPGRERRLRRWHRRRPYEADYARLEHLYERDLAHFGGEEGPDKRRARRALLAEVDRTIEHNPLRAQRLLELMLVRERGPRVGTLASRLASALEEVEHRARLDEIERRLVRLYVRNYHIEPHAVRAVRKVADRIDWVGSPDGPDNDELDMYLVVSDYERAFEHLTCKFDGVTLEHADKEGALRVRYFVEKRLDPNGLTRMVHHLFSPLEWLGSSVANVDFISTIVERALAVFETRVQRLDLSDQVVGEYRAQGIDLDRFEDIAHLNMGQVDRLMRNQKTMRLVLSAVAGGISGGLAPFSWAALSLADAPVLLGMTADICSRFCWYYGFDPREHPDLPMQIMAVGLGGSRAEAVEPMLLRQNLREYAIRKSLVVGALAHGGVVQLAGRTLGKLVEREAGKEAARRVGDLAKKTMTKNLQRRAAETIPSRTLPFVGAVLGATFNVALIYDVCEAAQAVLTDRFLERKYPDWIRKFELGRPPAHLAGDAAE